MATVDADVDVRRDEWRAAKGVKHAREIRPVDGERGLSTIVGAIVSVLHSSIANYCAVSSLSSLRFI